MFSMHVTFLFNNFSLISKWLTFDLYIQSTGAYQAAARLAIATPPPAYVLSRGIGWQVRPFVLAYFMLHYLLINY